MRFYLVQEASSYPAFQSNDTDSTEFVEFIKIYNKASQSSGIGNTFVAVESNEKIGSFSISNVSIKLSNMTCYENKEAIQAIKITDIKLDNNYKDYIEIERHFLSEAIKLIVLIAKSSYKRIILLDTSITNLKSIEEYGFIPLVNLPHTLLLSINKVEEAKIVTQA